MKLKVGQEVLLEDGSKGIIEEGDKIISEGKKTKGTYEIYSNRNKRLFLFVLDNRNEVIYSHIYGASEREKMRDDIDCLGDEFDSIHTWDGNDNLNLKNIKKRKTVGFIGGRKF